MLRMEANKQVPNRKTDLINCSMTRTLVHAWIVLSSFQKNPNKTEKVIKRRIKSRKKKFNVKYTKELVLT